MRTTKSIVLVPKERQGVRTLERDLVGAGRGDNHPRAACRSKDTKCQGCEWERHTAKACLAPQLASRSQRPPVSPCESPTGFQKAPFPRNQRREGRAADTREPPQTFIGYCSAQGCKKFHATVHIEGSPYDMELTVVNGDLPHLLGLEWFDSLVLEVTGIHTNQDDSIEKLVREFADVFDGAQKADRSDVIVPWLPSPLAYSTVFLLDLQHFA